MAGVRVRRQLYRAVAELVEQYSGQVVRRAAAHLDCEARELEGELVVVVGELHRRGGRRSPAQLDLEEWVWGRMKPCERGGRVEAKQLELFGEVS